MHPGAPRRRPFAPLFWTIPLAVGVACGGGGGGSTGPNPPASLAKTAGDGQTQEVTTVFAALQAKVADSNGGAVSGITVAWAVVSGPATLSQGSSTSNPSGVASIIVTAGASAGAVEIRATSASVPKDTLTYNLTVSPTSPPTALVKAAGDNQSQQVNNVFPTAVAAKVTDTAGVGLPGLQVDWAVTSGSATLGVNSSMTNAQGVATAGVTAGATPGPVVVRGTTDAVTTDTLRYSLTVTPQISTIHVGSAGGALTFTPANDVVSVGTQVNFVWDGNDHSVISDGPPSFSGHPDPANPPTTLSVIFSTAGTYNYHCGIHGGPGTGMHGSVTAQ
jgi:plastocyanin